MTQHPADDVLEFADVAGLWAWLAAHHDRVDDAVTRFQAYLQARPNAPDRQRVEAYWHWGWTLYRAGRYADAVTPLERSGALATHHLERGLVVGGLKNAITSAGHRAAVRHTVATTFS